MGKGGLFFWIWTPCYVLHCIFNLWEMGIPFFPLLRSILLHSAKIPMDFVREDCSICQRSIATVAFTVSKLGMTLCRTFEHHCWTLHFLGLFTLVNHPFGTRRFGRGKNRWNRVTLTLRQRSWIYCWEIPFLWVDNYFIYPFTYIIYHISYSANDPQPCENIITYHI